MTRKQRICVFASSENEIDEIYFKAASELGKQIALAGYDLVYGGSHRGLMYACAEHAKLNGADIIGVMPEKLANLGFANPEDCKEFYITAGMRERKAKLDEISDAVITLPGGFGTVEEISEMIVQKQLAYNNKPIVILNTNHFYDKLIEFFDEFISKNFASVQSSSIYYVASSPQDAVQYIVNYKPGKPFAKFVKS